MHPEGTFCQSPGIWTRKERGGEGDVGGRKSGHEDPGRWKEGQVEGPPSMLGMVRVSRTK